MTVKCTHVLDEIRRINIKTCKKQNTQRIPTERERESYIIGPQYNAAPFQGTEIRSRTHKFRDFRQFVRP